MTRQEYLEEYQGEIRVLQRLIGRAAEVDLQWRPRPDMMSVGQVIRHLSDSFADSLHSLRTGEWPYDPNAPLPTAEQMPAVAGVEEAISALERDQARTAAFLEAMTEKEFGHLPVSTPWGAHGRFERVAAAFLEHLKMHKMQLFLYLRMQGVALDTGDLYPL